MTTMPRAPDSVNDDPVFDTKIRALAHIESRSEPGKRWPVRLSPRTLRAVSCLCPGYRWSKRVPMRCTHMDSADEHITSLGLEVLS